LNAAAFAGSRPFGPVLVGASTAEKGGGCASGSFVGAHASDALSLLFSFFLLSRPFFVSSSSSSSSPFFMFCLPAKEACAWWRASSGGMAGLDVRGASDFIGMLQDLSKQGDAGAKAPSDPIQLCTETIKTVQVCEPTRTRACASSRRSRAYCPVVSCAVVAHVLTFFFSSPPSRWSPSACCCRIVTPS
jgi:hypothetical protein